MWNGEEGGRERAAQTDAYKENAVKEGQSYSCIRLGQDAKRSGGRVRRQTGTEVWPVFAQQSTAGVDLVCGVPALRQKCHSERSERGHRYRAALVGVLRVREGTPGPISVETKLITPPQMPSNHARTTPDVERREGLVR